MEFKKGLSVGVCYYPEHWPEDVWAGDLERMLKAGISTVRVGEFAWSILERTEGAYDFSFFDRFLDLCAEKGMRVIFGTPTATPPAWLTSAYPEVLNADRQGNPYRHGGRRHYNYTSPVYRAKVAELVTRLAGRYGHHSAVVAWQIDNELNCETADFLSEADGWAFRSFLQARYGTLEALNEAWGTVFWSQTYTDWGQVDVPKENAIHAHNPSLLLDYVRFVSESALSFAGMQSSIIRSLADPRQKITTNGMFSRMDNRRLTRESLDIYMYDSYPDFAYSVGEDWNRGGLHDRNVSRLLTRVRGICPHFGIMEQQSGANGWYNRMEAPMPRPGQIRLWAMQSVAHGADYVSFFRWRTSPVGTEIYWHGILDYESRDNRRLREVAGFARDLDRIQGVCGAESDARFALAEDMDNQFDAEFDAWHRRVRETSEQGLFEAAQERHVTYDAVVLDEQTRAEDLGRYPVVFAPHLVMVSESVRDTLEAYVREGGQLVIGCRTGYKDLNGRCPMRPMPGPLRALTGTTVEEYTFESPAEEPVFGTDGTREIPARVFMESLEAGEGTEVVARYAASYLAGEPLLTVHTEGRGRVWHFGSTLTREAALYFLDRLGLSEPYGDWLELPGEVEAVGRTAGTQRWVFLLNYLPSPAAFTVRGRAMDELTGETLSGGAAVPGYGVRVLRRLP